MDLFKIFSISGSGMAAGGWLAGLLHDRFGYYGAAFVAGLVFNLANLCLVGALVLRRQQALRPVAELPPA